MDGGLTWRDGHLWYGPIYSETTLYELDPLTGTVLNSYPNRIAALGDIAWDGTHFWETDATNGLIWKFDPGQSSLQNFPAPGPGPAGIEWDGSRIWVCDWDTDRISAIDPATGAEVLGFRGPDTRMAGLAFDGSASWVGGRDSGRLYRIDRSTGAVLKSVRSIALYGLAFDGTYLWACGLNEIYQIDISSMPQPIDPMIQWERTFDRTLRDYGTNVQQTPDGGFIVCGYSRPDFYLLKTDANGNRQWDRTFPKGLNANCLDQTSDGGYVLVGPTDSFTSPVQSYGMYLVKTDSNGNQQWDRTFLPAPDYSGQWIEQTSDGGYIIAGRYSSLGGVLLLKTDSAGNTQWERNLGSGIGECVHQTEDGGFVICGQNEGQTVIRLMKTDTSGSLQWERDYSGEFGRSVRQTSDGGYIIVGTVSVPSPLPQWGCSDLPLVKTDSSGIMQWQRTFGRLHNEVGRDVVETPDGGFIALGWTHGSFNVLARDVYIVRTDRYGNLLWQKVLARDGGWEWGWSVQQTADQGYIIAGRATEDVYLIKLRPEAPRLSTQPSWQLYR